MALFVDGSVSDSDDLAAQDAQLLDIASEEGVNVTQKLALAQDEIGLDLDSMLRSSRAAGWPYWFVQAPQLCNVVVTSALKLWHTYLTLELVYRDAYGNQLNDRYGVKRDQFHQLAESAREKLVQIGVGIALNPIPQAATPQLAPVEGSVPDGTYYVTMSWLNQSGEIGASALPEAITVTNSGFEVQPGSAPQSAAGWNVYVGNAPGSMFLQNTSLIEVDQAWRQLFAPASSGPAPGTGQNPTFFKLLPRTIWRG
ncbi:MAG: hypothetical protein JO336_13445 [Acidobacteriia bacterium]|nr:hypothetical protein [Terriglobia bacterium]MBV8902235.1 hypothetical protein [Terriglobia bacterium]